MAFHNAQTPEDVPDQGEVIRLFCAYCEQSYYESESDADTRGRFCSTHCEVEDRAESDASTVTDGVLVPRLRRHVTPEMLELLCRECGTRVRWHFDGWDGNRLDCAEATKRGAGR